MAFGTTYKERCVDLKLGRRLKELGFNYPTYTYQVNADNGAIITSTLFAHNLNPDRVALPSLSLVAQWLSNEKGIDVIVRPAYTEENVREFTYEIGIFNDESDIMKYDEYFTERNDALETGVLTALDFVV